MSNDNEQPDMGNSQEIKVRREIILRYLDKPVTLEDLIEKIKDEMPNNVNLKNLKNKIRYDLKILFEEKKIRLATDEEIRKNVKGKKGEPIDKRHRYYIINKSDRITFTEDIVNQIENYYESGTILDLDKIIIFFQYVEQSGGPFSLSLNNSEYINLEAKLFGILEKSVSYKTEKFFNNLENFFNFNNQKTHILLLEIDEYISILAHSILYFNLELLKIAFQKNINKNVKLKPSKESLEIVKKEIESETVNLLIKDSLNTLEVLTNIFEKIINKTLVHNKKFLSELKLSDGILNFNINDNIPLIRYDYTIYKQLNKGLKKFYKIKDEEISQFIKILNVLIQQYKYKKFNEKDINDIKEDFLFPYKYKDPFRKKLTKIIMKSYKKLNYEIPMEPIKILKKFDEIYENYIVDKNYLADFIRFILDYTNLFYELINILALLGSEDFCKVIKNFLENDNFNSTYLDLTVLNLSRLFEVSDYDFNILFIFLNPLYVINEFFIRPKNPLALYLGRISISEYCISDLNKKIEYFRSRSEYSIVKLIGNILNVYP